MIERDIPLPANERNFLHAAKGGDLAALASLLAKGVPVDVLDNRPSVHWDAWGQTALMHASAGDHAEAVRWLLSKGAKITAKDRGGWDSEYDCGPLHYAVLGRGAVAAEVLLDAGANPNAVSHLGFTPLGLAVQQKNTAAVKLLVRRGADVNLRPKRKRYIPPVHVAVCSKDPGILRLLLEAGATVDALNACKETALMYVASAPENIAVEMAKVLLKAGANVNCTGNGSSPLLRAVLEANAAVTRELLSAGADPDVIYESLEGTVREIVERRLENQRQQPVSVFGQARLQKWQAMAEVLDGFRKGKRDSS